jgi:hypothetical protein
MEALELLDDLFSECVFTGGPKSAWASVPIAALMSAAVRHALPIAPAFGVSAHKTRLRQDDTRHRDRSSLRRSQAPSPRPQRHLGGVTQDAARNPDRRRRVRADNVTKPVDSAALCAVLTSSTYSDGALGLNQPIVVPTAVTWLITGNHLEFVGDLITRVVLSVLDPEMDSSSSPL